MGFPQGLQVLRSLEIIIHASAAPGLVVFGARWCTAANTRACPLLSLRGAAKISPGAGEKKDLLWGLVPKRESWIRGTTPVG